MFKSNFNLFYRYWLFESWGRISTSIGSKRLTDFATLQEACTKFKSVYKDKVGYEFEKGNHYFKSPGKFMHLDIDFEIDKQMPISYVKSKLNKPVYDLMKMIFDIKHMKNMMMSCDVDLKQMPLGKLSTNQIYAAMLVLKTISKLIQENGTLAQLRYASNEFYTKIPHGFSIKRPPIIDSMNVIKAKNEMLEGLLNMGMIHGFFEGENGEQNNPMDVCYEKIKTNISVLDKDAPEFIQICKIVRDTHGFTHNQYTLEVVDVFRIKRKREDVRSRKYKKLENHQMLWHGSRLTNFVSILTKGLKIAPKEAPSTGKRTMFTRSYILIPYSPMNNDLTDFFIYIFNRLHVRQR